MPSLPTGTVTFLFTDVEGSTTLLQRLGDRRYAEVLAEHQRLLRDAFAKGNGQEIDTQGDAFLVAFSRARDAVATAVAAQQSLMKHTWPDSASLQVRMGLHTGEPISNRDRYVGLDVHRAARIGAAGHGGQILLSDAVSGLAARDLPPGVSLRDLGTHRLKDLREPEHLLQVVHPDLPAGFPPLKSLDVLPNNLPRQFTSFIGREKDITEIKRLVSSVSLVTLTGQGGAGKTRLALQVAADVLERYPDGVWLAELASLSDPTLVPQTVISAFGVPEQPGRPPIDTLTDYLRPKSLLLVLDNCEHLLSACADVVDALLRVCRDLRVLATSREPLGLAGEAVWRVPPLSVPDLRHPPLPEELLRYEAVRLFAQRASFSDRDFVLTSSNAPAVAKVCSRLDGIPLAIELAAARVKVLTVEQIAQRLDDRFRLLTGGGRKVLARQQTLRAAMDWSYALLSEPERALLRRISVFAGGCTVEAVEAICAGEGVEQADILDLLTQLLDKSLVLIETQCGEARYRLLETVREYAQSKLAEGGGAERMRKLHRDWYCALAERAQSRLGWEQMTWLKRLEAEHDNLRAALEGSIAEDAEAGLRLGGALWQFWVLHTHHAEGRQWMERVLARGGEASSSVRLRALHSAGVMATRQYDYERAATLYEESLILAQELGDATGVASAHMLGGLVAAGRGDYEAATVLYEKGLEWFRQLNDPFHTAWALAVIGSVARYKGDCAKAAAVSGESVDLFRTLGATWGVAYSLRFLGHAVRHENLKRAADLYTESLALYQEVGDKRVAEQCLEGLAVVASALNEDEPAGRLFGAAEAARETSGSRMTAPGPDLADHERFTRATRQRLGDECFAAAWAKGRAMTLEQAIEYALTEGGV